MAAQSYWTDGAVTTARGLPPGAGAYRMISNEPIFRIHAELADILHLGATPYGDRRVINILGGQIEGPRLVTALARGAREPRAVRLDVFEVL
jgi:hypothetical protein